MKQVFEVLTVEVNECGGVTAIVPGHTTFHIAGSAEDVQLSVAAELGETWKPGLMKVLVRPFVR